MHFPELTVERVLFALAAGLFSATIVFAPLLPLSLAIFGFGITGVLAWGVVKDGRAIP